MSLTIPYVSDGINVEKPMAVHKRFVEFFPEESTTDQDLCDVVVNDLEKLELNA